MDRVGSVGCPITVAGIVISCRAWSQPPCLPAHNGQVTPSIYRNLEGLATPLADQNVSRREKTSL
jgi:hypothetical protein